MAALAPAGHRRNVWAVKRLRLKGAYHIVTIGIDKEGEPPQRHSGQGDPLPSANPLALTKKGTPRQRRLYRQRRDTHSVKLNSRFLPPKAILVSSFTLFMLLQLRLS
jgi:hypothetical protein